MLQDLARLWANKPGWTILDTAFQGGGNFEAVCRLWRTTAAPAQVLHYVAFCDTLQVSPSFRAYAQADAGPDFDHLHPGFNRILLNGGAISLTLCIGAASKMLAELRMQADTIWHHANGPAWPDTDWKQLALNCKVGTQLYFSSTSSDTPDALMRHGFTLLAGSQSATESLRIATYSPRWNLKRSRRLVNEPVTADRCAVIGGGLSGASVAHALALRGWQVTVYDSGVRPSSGASGLPAGLCVATTSLDSNPQTRLSRQGVRLCLSHARRLLASNIDWKYSGVLEKVDPQDPQRDVLHPHAAWLKPAALVEAWINHQAVHWAGGNTVESLQRLGTHWILKGGNARDLGQFDLVVFANASGCKPMIESLGSQVALNEDVLRKLGAMQLVHGSVSSGANLEPGNERPMNGSGSWIGNVPSASGTRWYAGATYELQLQHLQDHAAQHAANLRRLRALCPQSAQTMAAAIAAKTIQIWSGTRCVTQDRLPLVGHLDAIAAPGLWVCAGMGSRGLSLAALCAELLAAYIHSEPLPLEHSLAKSLSINRPAKGRSTPERSDFSE